jgi:predicted nucleic acid-binding protein
MHFRWFWLNARPLMTEVPHDSGNCICLRAPTRRQGEARPAAARPRRRALSCGECPSKGLSSIPTCFVAAGFNPRSASARVLAATRDGRFRLIWNRSTRRETELILVRIPRLDWERFADLFHPEGEFTGRVDLDAFALIADPDDRKFAALSAVVQRPLVTNDNDLLAARNVTGIDALTPRAFLAREGKKI